MIAEAHGPYAQAVMNALDGLADPATSWAEITPDLEIVITLARDSARGAGWKQGLVICWDQAGGWHWADMLEEGVSSIPRRLLSGVVVADPGAVRRAVEALLSGRDGYKQLPQVGELRPDSGYPLLTTAVEEALRDLPREIALDLAAYATRPTL